MGKREALVGTVKSMLNLVTSNTSPWSPVLKLGLTKKTLYDNVFRYCQYELF